MATANKSVAAESCCLHFPCNKPETIVPLTIKTRQTLDNFTKQWALTNKEPERTLSIRFQQLFSCNDDQDDDDDGVCCNHDDQQQQQQQSLVMHKSCYCKITSRPKLEKALNAANEVSTI